MAKFYGKIGYVEFIETAPGVTTETVNERIYRGDVIKTSRRWKSGESLNDDLTISNEISVIADPFAYENVYALRYVNWMGANWKITKVDIQRPRLILSIGGVYNGQSGPASSAT